MDIAIVTGAQAGFGLSVARRLIKTGCRVYGLSWDFSQTDFSHNDFRPFPCNLADPEAVASAVDQILEAEGSLFAVMHCAQLLPTHPLEATETEELTNAIHVGLLCPLILARKALPSLMKTRGYIVTLGWNGRGVSPGGATGAAVLGGTHRLAEALFDEVRDTGVKVTTIIPQPNPGKADSLAQFRSEPQSIVDPERVADVVEQVLRFRENNGLAEVVVQPMGEREDPVVPKTITRLPTVKEEYALPPRSLYPQEPEPIPTPDRQRPDDAPPPEDIEAWEDEIEEEVFLDDDALMEKYIRGHGRSGSDESGEDAPAEEGEPKKAARKDDKGDGKKGREKRPKGPAKMQLKTRGPAPRPRRNRLEDWPGRRRTTLEGSVVTTLANSDDEHEDDEDTRAPHGAKADFDFEDDREDFGTADDAGEASNEPSTAPVEAVSVVASEETPAKPAKRRRRNAVRKPPGGIGGGPSRQDME
ncbi:MAG: SDR family NAD(P)-dependent oxidoreductase [Opitutales bacterium]